jgi:hypothetical protein
MRRSPLQPSTNLRSATICPPSKDLLTGHHHAGPPLEAPGTPSPVPTPGSPRQTQKPQTLSALTCSLPTRTARPAFHPTTVVLSCPIRSQHLLPNGPCSSAHAPDLMCPNYLPFCRPPPQSPPLPHTPHPPLPPNQLPHRVLLFFLLSPPHILTLSHSPFPTPYLFFLPDSPLSRQLSLPPCYPSNSPTPPP